MYKNLAATPVAACFIGANFALQRLPAGNAA